MVKDLFESMGIEEHKEGLPDTHARIVGRPWSSAFPKTLYDVKTLDAWKFGQPELRHDNEGWGAWESKALQAKFKDSYDTNRQFRYGNWAVHLNGGPQASGESWASISVPINQMRVKDLISIEYDWYAHQLGTSHILDIGPNLVWSAYDPNDHSKRVDFNTYAVDNNLFMADGLANRPVEAGWYRYLLTSDDATERVYYYANNDGTHTPCATDGADYYWSQYIVDTVFASWVIYRIQIMIGYWGATRSTGDVWIGGMKINGEAVKWEPSEADKIALRVKEENMFGKPTLMSNNNSRASWFKSGTSPYYQKSSTGYLAKLYGGLQTGDDWAAVFIPVNEMHVPDLKTALWSYHMSANDSFGVNMVIWVHDPFNFDNRAEITQRQQHADLDKAAGWGAHELDPSTDYFFFYGETTTKTNLSAGTDYGWDDFVADELFNTWTIYRISYEFGWQASGTFGTALIADIELNGQQIPLGPASGSYKTTVIVAKTMKAAAKTADEVISDDADWDFEFGGTGYITKAIATHDAALTSRVSLLLFSRPVAGAVNDEAANDNPLTAEQPYYLGRIDFPAFSYNGTGDASTIATPSTYGNLPLAFDAPLIYGVLIAIDATTTVAEVLTIALTAEMESN